MSTRKFASITGSLLARKGEAGPSPALERDAEKWAPVFRENPATAKETEPHRPSPDAGGRAIPLPPPSGRDREPAAGPHRLTFRLDDERHRRLAIAAAHLLLPVQQLLATALDRYLAELSDTDLRDCACLKRPGRRDETARACLGDVRRPA